MSGEYEETITVPCDDDHFASSEIDIHFVARGVDGVMMTLKPQLGRLDTVFLHTGEITQLIKALEKAKCLIKTHGRVAREGGWTCEGCSYGPCFETHEPLLELRCGHKSKKWKRSGRNEL